MKRKIYLYVKALSDFGTMLDMIVLNLLILSVTEHAYWLAACFAARTLGGFLSSLSSGLLADKYERRKIMIYSDILRAACLLLVIPFPDPVMIIVVSFLVGFVSSYFSVSFSAEVPRMFGEDNVLQTNALISRLMSVAMIAGFFLSGLLYDWFGFETVIAIDAFSFLLSAWVLTRLKWDSGKGAVVSQTDRKPIFSRIMGDMKEVKDYLIVKPLLLIVFFLCLVQTFGAGSHNLGVPLLAEGMSESAMFYGLIWGVWAMGNVLMTLLLPKMAWVKRRMHHVFFISSILMSLGFIVFLANTSPWIVFPVAFMTGFFDAGATTLYSTIVQQSDNHVRGRVFGISALLNRLGFFIGFIVSPILLELTSLPQMVTIMHGFVLLCIFAAMIWLSRIQAQTHKNASV